MSVFPNAQNSHIHLQDSPLTAVAGDQWIHVSGPATVASGQHIAGNQINYHAAPLKGDSPSSFATFSLTFEVQLPR